MDIRIKSDGKFDTKIYDATSNSIIGRVQKLTWEAKVGEMPKCTLEILGLPLEVEKIEAEIKTV